MNPVIWARSTHGHEVRGQKFVLVILATYCSPKTGVVYTDEATLAKDCDMPSRTIQRHIKGLRRQGFITLGQRANQHQGTEFILPIDCDPDTIVEHPPLSVVAPATSEVSSEGSTRHLTHELPPLVVSAPATGGAEQMGLLEERAEDPDEAREDMSKSEEKNKIDAPEWIQVLARDSRWAPRDRFAEDMEEMFPQLDLRDQAISAYEWLQTPKGKRKPKGLGMFFLNWLKRAAADQVSVNGRRAAPHMGNTVEDVAEAERQVRGGNR